MPAANRVEIAGVLLERGSLRYTPAGVPVVEFRITHVSEQGEAGTTRCIECELPCIAIGAPALLLREVPPGIGIGVTGFLAARSLKQKTLVLHATAIEFAEILKG